MLLKIGVLHAGGMEFNLRGLALLLSNPYVLGGLGTFAASFFVWIKVLAVVPLSYAYPMVSLGYVLVFLFSWLFLGESLPAPRILGLVLIIGGIFLVARS